MSQYENLLLELSQCHRAEEVMAYLESLFERSEYEKEHYNKIIFIAQNYLKQSNYAVCRTILMKLYAQRKTVSCIYYLALTDYRLGYNEKALDWIQKIPESRATAKCQLLKAKIIFRLYPAQAITLLKQLTKEMPHEHEPYALLARYYESQSQFEKAVIYYKVLLDYFQTNIEVNRIKLEFAECLLQMEVIDIIEIEKTLQNIEDGRAYYLLGLAYTESQRYKEAVKALEMCVELDNEWLPAHVSLLELYAYDQKLNKFNATFNWLFETLPEYDSFVYDIIKIAYSYNQVTEQSIEKLATYVVLQEEFKEDWWEAVYLLVEMIQVYYGYTSGEILNYLEFYGIELMESDLENVLNEKGEGYDTP